MIRTILLGTLLTLSCLGFAALNHSETAFLDSAQKIEMQVSQFKAVLSHRDFIPKAVPYTLEGTITVYRHEGIVLLHTTDGRTFSLRKDKSSKFDPQDWHGRVVQVEGWAAESDELDEILVAKIKEIDPSAPVPPTEHVDFQRPAQLVSHVGQRWEVGNVRWGEEKPSTWETVTIDPSLIEKVYFAQKPFAKEKLVAHTFLVFRFKPGGAINNRGEETRSLVLSVEAYMRKSDKKLDLRKAAVKKEYPIVWMLSQWENYLTNACRDKSERLVLYPTAFSKEQSVSLLHEALQQATVNRAGEFYNTRRNNCTNNILILFNHVLSRPIPLWTIPGTIYNLRATNSTWATVLLRERGIIGESLPEINPTNYTKSL
ncbi:MAG: DUF4105 domain-containing protein [Elusimicrobia bacterium]|nr:DUF4105 domain-containing protein [Elusimicrobiota bacterium]